MKFNRLFSTIAIVSSLFVSFASDAQAANVQELGLAKGPAIRVINIGQYTNRMPTIIVPGETMPSRDYTIVDFVTVACKTLRTEDFVIDVKASGRVQVLEIDFKPNSVDCMGLGRAQQVSISTNKASRRLPILISNPVLVEQLPDAF